MPVVTVNKTAGASVQDYEAPRSKPLTTRLREVTQEGKGDWTAPVRETPAPGQALKKNPEMM